MISITDIKDFIDLDKETVVAVSLALGLPAGESIALAYQLLATETGVTMLHHMFRDQITAAKYRLNQHQEDELRRPYRYFSRTYPMPQLAALAY